MGGTTCAAVVSVGGIRKGGVLSSLSAQPYTGRDDTNNRARVVFFYRGGAPATVMSCSMLRQLFVRRQVVFSRRCSAGGVQQVVFSSLLPSEVV